LTEALKRSSAILPLTPTRSKPCDARLAVGEFVRDRLPDPTSFFEAQGVPLTGRGKWRTGRCVFHGGSDSLRVNVKTGGWRCMACGESGDMPKYLMARDGIDFATAARALGAYIDDGRSEATRQPRTTLSPRDAMELATFELTVALIVICDVRSGSLPSETDWHRFLQAVARLEAIAQEYRA
jgi:hypothetical protein